jgi:hypothetical protein
MRRICYSILIVVFCSAGWACKKTTFGQGIGKPKFAAPAPQILAITEVNAFASLAEIHNTSRTKIELSEYKLCGSLECVVLTEQLESNKRRTIAIPTLNLSPNAGELAIESTDSVVEDYVTWGATPESFNSALFIHALEAGRTSAYVPLPFPVPADVTVAFEMMGNGCATPSPDAVAEIDPTRCTEPTSRPLRLSEIAFAPQAVEIENRTGSVIRLDAVRLCFNSSCYALPFNTTIAANDFIVVQSGTEGLDSKHIHVDFPELGASGEVALLGPSGLNAVAASKMLGYVRYGLDAPADDTDTAVTAALWSNTSDYAKPPRIASETISINRLGQAGPLGWNPTAATLVAANPDAERPYVESGTTLGDAWTSCSFPRPWRAPVTPSPLVIASVTPAAVTLLNRSSTVLDLTGYHLLLGVSDTALSGTLAPGETQSNSATLAKIGEASLSLGSNIVFHLQWGTAAPINVGAAVTAGVWPLDTCRLGELSTRIDLTTAARGDSPVDYTQQ